MNRQKIQTIVSACLGGLVLALPVALSGCGGGDDFDRAAVKGEVTLDNKPLEKGVIRFIPTGETTGPATVATIEKGHYELGEKQGPLVGSHRVEIEALDYYSFSLDDEAAYVTNVEQQPNRLDRKMPPNPVPAMYYKDSILTAEVKADNEEPTDFQLMSRDAAVTSSPGFAEF